MIEPFEVYKLYLAVKLHFTKKDYDIIKYRGKVRIKEETYKKRKDLVSIKKLARDYDREEVVNFLVANFVSGERWGGLFDTDAARRYKEWTVRKNQREYRFQQDVSKILLEMETKNITNPFIEKNGEHPLTFRLFFGNIVSIESVVILDKIYNWCEQLDDILLDDTVLLVKKYRPFVKVTDNMKSVVNPLNDVL
tara:strand:- start:3246 stop:3827 length:582 start_codon:yes stop_codon:yes gene_type:complete